MEPLEECTVPPAPAPSSPETKGTNRVREHNIHTLNWFKTKEFRTLIKKFHDSKAHFPKKPIKEANEKREAVTGDVRSYLQRNYVCYDIQYTGSSYEGIKVASTELEYDIMVILRDDSKCLAREIVRPGYSKLRIKPEVEGGKCRWRKNVKLVDGYLPAEEIIRWFYGEMKKCVDKALAKHEFKLRHHGPAIQLDVLNDEKKLWFSIDVVPAFKIGEEYYVAKPFKEERQRLHHQQGDKNLALSWRKSFSMDEKKLMSNIDTENKCRRQCLRILKVIKDQDGPLRCLESYCIKTCLLHVNKEFPDDRDWDSDKLGERIVDVLYQLSSFAHQQYLPNFFEPKMNVFVDYQPVTLSNIAYRIDRLLNSKVSMRKLLSVDTDSSAEEDHEGLILNTNTLEAENLKDMSEERFVIERLSKLLALLEKIL